ncbi:hypothetical protein [Treponema sp.]|uniref:hypothetical protein n=1 Tax=Treponema sp. TaxID=166 RepID=UPI00388DA0C9
MQLEEFYIDDTFLVRTSGTSDGTQDKFFKNGLWFKLDRYGGEGIAECVASIILEECGLESSKFVKYTPCLINGRSGCYSKNFLNEDEAFITLYRLYKNVTGRDLADVCSKMDYDDAIEYVINFVKQQTALDIHEYLANTFALDKVILNDDRHFNNMGIVYNGVDFKTAPIFDNGKSFLIGNKKARQFDNISDKIKTAFAKCFSPSFDMNARYLQKYQTVKISLGCINEINKFKTDKISEMIKILEETLK